MKGREILIALLLLGLAAPLAAKVKVVTTMEYLAAIARDVGGDRVEAEAVGKGFEDPHFVSPKPSYLLKLRDADLFVETGLDLEVGWSPPLLRGSRNVRIQPGGPGYVDASVGVAVLEVPVLATRAEGDVHPYGNPHYWLDPQNGAIVARNIAEGLERVDPQGAATYEANLRAFAERLQAKLAEWTRALAPYRGVELVTYHRMWPYFERRFGLVFAGELEPKPGIPPSPRHLAELTETMKAKGIRLVVRAPYYSPKPCEELARRTGAVVVNLPTDVGADKEVRDYFDLFDRIVEELGAALAKAPSEGG